MFQRAFENSGGGVARGHLFKIQCNVLMERNERLVTQHTTNGTVFI